MNRNRLEWYWHRLRAMSAGEAAQRAEDRLRQARWRARQVRPGQDPGPAPASGARPFSARLPPNACSAVPAAARDGLIEAAEELMKGRAVVLGLARDDLAAPDWFLDPITGRRAPHDVYAFRIDHRSEEQTGNIKQVWELSRHHHLTVLAGAWYLTGDDRYAERVGSQLTSWWQANPFLSGVHWTGGIELGLRLIAWTWVRRLLDGWAGVADLFDHNDLFCRQLHWHQEYLAAFASAGSSSNNHAIAEAAGQLVAGCAFDWFEESDRWRAAAARRLERHLARNTFPSGINRELASEYHGFVALLGLVAAIEAGAAGHGLSDSAWQLLCRTVDAGAAMVDQCGRPPRQGDGDDGQALVIDGEGGSAWSTALAAGAGLFGSLPWWPAVSGGVSSTLLCALAGHRPPVPDRPAERPDHLADAGLTILRTPEIWCRCDGGPHGFLSTAAHAHADALSVEVRHGGVDVLADPGTYCYHGEPGWRGYFRSTLGHNTVELGGRDQSRSGGPFLWVRHAGTTVLEAGPDRWAAEHDGYRGLEPPIVHRRRVQLDRDLRQLLITDHLVIEAAAGHHRTRMAFHLGPAVLAELEGCTAKLTWPGGDATFTLPGQLRWSAHRGEVDPVLGWYSPQFGLRQPATTLLGEGELGASDLVSVIQFERGQIGKQRSAI